MSNHPDVQTARDAAPLLLRACREALAVLDYPYSVSASQSHELRRVSNLLRNAIAQAEGRK